MTNTQLASDNEVAVAAPEPVPIPASEVPLFDKLLTTDQTTLLDLIDTLRSHGVSNIIDFPQIIVCGDQSSGKSSVLEAISRVSFPKDSSVCTLFPTELALRRGPTRKVKVQLKPSAKRSEEEAQALESFVGETDNLDLFAQVITNAKDRLHEVAGIDKTANSFFTDILHVEVTDPHWPLLTVVDLPGIISAANPEQMDEDVDIPWELCSTYMANQKSIILAVIGANNETNVTRIWKLIKQHDPDRKRTICVFTKPDRVEFAKDAIPKFVEFASNTTPGWHFDLGWHIVRNAGPQDYGSKISDRDAIERRFFAQAPWAKSLDKHQLGINSLRDRLSGLLEKHIRDEMPKLFAEIKEKLGEATRKRNRLGDARPTMKDQRMYLIQLSQNFQAISKEAIYGYYQDTAFFLPNPPAGDPRRLRAAIQNHNEQFNIDMRYAGHSVSIFELGPNETHTCWPDFNHVKVDPKSNPISLEPEPPKMARDEYIKQIKRLSIVDKGRETMGSVNTELAGVVFKIQSAPWRRLATKHVEVLWKCIYDHLSLIANHIASKDTARALRQHLIDKDMERRYDKVMEKVEELLKPYEKGHPITYDPSYLRNYQKLGKTATKKPPKERLLDHQPLNKSEGFATHPSPARNIQEVPHVLDPNEEIIAR